MAVRKEYFINLDGFRFIAASIVLASHSVDYAVMLGLMNHTNKINFPLIASLAVSFFFVLSGFLITYLLLKEKQTKSKIDFRAFYRKRAFRILPLYYLTVFAGIYILPVVDQRLYNEHSLTLLNVLCFLFMLPNLALVFFPANAASHTWSIGVEEQFYLIWPFIISYGKRILLLLIALFFFLMLLSNASAYLSVRYADFHLLKKLSSFLYMFRIQSMVVGGIAAWFFFYHEKKISGIRGFRLIQVTVIITLLLLLLFSVEIKYIEHEMFSVLFAILILTSVCKERTIINLEYPLIKTLGKMSYGIYMYQPVANTLVYLIFKAYFGHSVYSLWFFFVINFLTVIAVSYVSFRFFESPLIQYGKRQRNESIS